MKENELSISTSNGMGGGREAGERDKVERKQESDSGGSDKESRVCVCGPRRRRGV
jgi:hypothetical protein